MRRLHIALTGSASQRYVLLAHTECLQLLMETCCVLILHGHIKRPVDCYQQCSAQTFDLQGDLNARCGKDFGACLDHLMCVQQWADNSKCVPRCKSDNECPPAYFCRDGKFCEPQVMCFFDLCALVLCLVHNSILFKQVVFGAVQKGEGFECQRNEMCWKDAPYCTDWRCSKQQGGGCFPSHATVQVEDRGRVRMADLAYGDRVLARDHQGRLVFREVGSYRSLGTQMQCR
jgi:hypothetical protein